MSRALLQYLSLFSAFALDSPLDRVDYAKDDKANSYSPEQLQELKKQAQKYADSRRHKNNGLTQFFYGENYVWAINQKNADRKAKKLGYI